MTMIVRGTSLLPRLWSVLPRSLATAAGPDVPLSANDSIGSHVRNKNPMNLERMRIGYKPSGFPLERKSRSYWNKLELTITNQHTTARVVHWTGRPVCQASTREWAIRRFLYNYTDAVALDIVGKVVGQRCLETGVLEVSLQMDDEDFKKDKMRDFVKAIRSTGLTLTEGKQYHQCNVHKNLSDFNKMISVRPWEFVDE